MYKGNLVEYLENEIEKIKEEIENKKNRHYVNQNIINECNEKIKEYMDKEDSVFNLLSPIGTESSYKVKIEEQKKVIEETTIENLNIISEIDDCNNKIQEIEKQLELQRISGEQQSKESISSSPASLSALEQEQQEDWMCFIDKILGELKEAEACCYTNPKLCKDKIADLYSYINKMCYGRN